ncbi:hypothetical protein M885DRAFT_614582 [Pelagophyceae sp. CCMP2097]|nr:hypothetical protein M885DRAFT_614582 [Pelagophyceae sp. CCMP2097]
MRAAGLLVALWRAAAAAESVDALGAAAQREWYDAQTSFAECYGRGGPRPDRFVVWGSTSALGNALNVFGHIFLYALASGRQIVVGPGLVPQLLCGPEGAFHCGAAAPDKAWFQARKHSSTGESNRINLFDVKHELLVGFTSVNYHGVKSAFSRAPGETASNLTICAAAAVKCPRPGDLSRGQMDHEACVMVRAMQFLFPGHRLRPRFQQRALVTAQASWLGDHDELRNVLRGDLKYDAESAPLFYDPPANDAATRFAAALHFRVMPPAFESPGVWSTQREASVNGVDLKWQHFAQLLNASHPRYNGVWGCVGGNAAKLTRGLAEKGHLPANDELASLFIAADSAELCPLAQAAAQASGAFRVACMNVAPLHMTKKKPVENHGLAGEAESSAGAAAAPPGGLDSRLLGVLDWHLLARSRLFAAQTRVNDECRKGAPRDGTHSAHVPGRSFAGWAYAASGLVPPPANASGYKFGCACAVNSATAAFWRQDLKP